MNNLLAKKEKNKIMLKVIGEFLMIYLLYKIIFDLVIPAITITKRTKQMMDDIHQQQNQNSSNTNTTASSNATKRKINDEEYIDYEEVK